MGASAFATPLMGNVGGSLVEMSGHRRGMALPSAPAFTTARFAGTSLRHTDPKLLGPQPREGLYAYAEILGEGFAKPRLPGVETGPLL